MIVDLEVRPQMKLLYYKRITQKVFSFSSKGAPIPGFANATPKVLKYIHNSHLGLRCS